MTGHPELTKRAYRYRARKLIKDGCELCPNPEGFELHVHHLDKDESNNERSNLLTLCRGCHHEIHGKQRSGRKLPIRKERKPREVVTPHPLSGKMGPGTIIVRIS